MRRRELLGALGATALAGCNTLPVKEPPAPHPPGNPLGKAKGSRPVALPQVLASAGRITKITVCTRPFRPLGPRIEAEQIGAQTIIHNYGHGGSGWSLSWGSAAVCVPLALAAAGQSGQRRIGVLGAGALGLTAAITAQRAGAQVTLYARELPPETRSSFATGSFTPSSRICTADAATPAFKERWEQMARTSFKAYTNLLGLAGDPVEFVDTYYLSDQPFGQQAPSLAAPRTSGVEFADLEGELIPDLFPPSEVLDPSPFAPPYARRSSNLMFNLVAYQRLLLQEFQINGGQIQITELHSAADFAKLPEKTIINATGYGARALLGDNSLVPVRGQLARLIPQPEVRYALMYDNVYFLPRRDGLVVQEVGADESKGYNDDTTVPDRAEAERAVAVVARAVAGISPDMSNRTSS